MIRVVDLRLRIGPQVILSGVSFSVERGESVAIVGPNGSGKTSVLRCILGLVPFQGEAQVGGHDVRREPVAARTLMSYLPQRPAFGDSTADEVLRFVARLRRLDVGRIQPALRNVGLEAQAHVKARTFSGGMQQRLSLAAALLADSPVLLLDEPTASLDTEGQQSFLVLAEGLRRQGRTLLFTSHRPEETSRLADRVLELENGRLLSTQSQLPAPAVQVTWIGSARRPS